MDTNIILSAIAIGVSVVAVVFTYWQAHIAKNTAECQLRAYVGIDKLEFEAPNLDKTDYVPPQPNQGAVIFEDFVLPTIKNYGSTPAYEVFIHVQVVGISSKDSRQNFSLNLPNDFDFLDRVPNEGLEKGRVISRQTLQPAQTAVPKVPFSDVGGLRKAHAKENTLYAFGHIDYTDIFKRRWSNVFCFLYEPWRPEGHRFIPYERNNYEKRIKTSS